MLTVTSRLFRIIAAKLLKTVDTVANVSILSPLAHTHFYDEH
jgi:hypothetical protein